MSDYTTMTDALQQEYAAALAAFKAAQARLIEAKRHIPPTARDLRKQQDRAAREAAMVEASAPAAIALRERLHRECHRVLMNFATQRLRNDITQVLDDRRPFDSIIIRMPDA
jgi:hypothetical protein